MGGGATGAVGRLGDGRRGYRGRGEVGRREKGLQRPWVPEVKGGGATRAVVNRGDGTPSPTSPFAYSVLN